MDKKLHLNKTNKNHPHIYKRLLRGFEIFIDCNNFLKMLVFYWVDLILLYGKWVYD